MDRPVSVGIALVLVCLVASRVQAAGPTPLGGQAGEPEPKVQDSTPLMDLKESVQQIEADNLRLHLTLEGAMPRGNGGADLTIDVARVAGKWQAGTGKTPEYNQATHEVDASAVKTTGEGISGTMVVTVKPDRWVPKDGKTQTLKVDVNLDLGKLRRVPSDDGEVPIRFWKIMPKSQGPARSVKGTFTAKLDGKATKGKAGGYLNLPVRRGRWNMGSWDNGLAMQLDMGTQRVNWNHVRLAIHEFAKVRDLRKYDGLRLTARTPRARTDVGVSVWLRESDGSWYYVKDALPLAKKQTDIVLRLSDFVEAEWVSPTNHMDEDYVLDLSEISHIGLGVVNSLGVGKVDFTIEAIDLVNLPPQTTEPARVVATGNLLRVNGHDVVPPGVFGGYAPEIPQQYRPGCQRHLYAPSYPRVPDHMHLNISPDEIADAGKIMAVLGGDSALARHVVGLLDERFTERTLARYRKDKRRVPRSKDLSRSLGRLLRNRDLYDATLWKDVELDKDLRAAAAKLARDATHTEIMKVNRRLLTALFAGGVKPETDQRRTEAFFIECFGERFEPALILGHGDWKQRLAGFGRRYASNAKANRYPARLEFWNEPYLNWAERSRVNYNLKFYDVSKAKEGGPVHLKRGVEVPHLRWRKVGGKWQVYDPSAFSYWSGRANGWMYDQMLGAISKAVKDTYPAVRVIGGWGFRYNEDHWAAWDILYKPTIDRNIETIDGIHEHHYQGDPTALTGTYEVLTAYAQTRYDKWLHSYNTETNDLVDAPARGAVDTPEKARRAKEYRRMTYNLRDMLHVIWSVPDKYQSRTMIHYNHTPKATEIAFGLTRDLRGRLVETRTTDPDVWCLSSIDGTDPNAMPDDGGKTMVVFVFNDHRSPRDVEIAIDAPAGTTFDGGRIDRTEVDKSSYEIGVKSEKLDTKLRRATEESHRRVRLKVSLDGRTACKVSLPLKGEIKGESEIRRVQHFSPDVLQTVRPGEAFDTKVKIDKDALSGARSAWLRLVVEDIAPGEGVVTVGGKTIALPKAYTADNQTHIVEVPVAVEDLSAETKLTFAVRDESDGAGYRVDMASVVTESEK